MAAVNASNIISKASPETTIAIEQTDPLIDPIISQNNNSSTRQQQQQQVRKKLPQATVCHGCCVKITSKLPNGSVYVKRTCTTKLQINYFIVGLVCMKESGDRGKMCFCETDYCNGAITKRATTSEDSISAATLCKLVLFLTVSLLFQISAKLVPTTATTLQQPPLSAAAAAAASK